MLYIVPAQKSEKISQAKFMPNIIGIHDSIKLFSGPESTLKKPSKKYQI